MVLDALLTLKVRDVCLIVCKMLVLDFVTCLQAAHFRFCNKGYLYEENEDILVNPTLLWQPAHLIVTCG